jgi:hypothetical protein
MENDELLEQIAGEKLQSVFLDGCTVIFCSESGCKKLVKHFGELPIYMDYSKQMQSYFVKMRIENTEVKSD